MNGRSRGARPAPGSRSRRIQDSSAGTPTIRSARREQGLSQANSVGVSQSNNRQANSVGVPQSNKSNKFRGRFTSQTTVKQIPWGFPQSNNRQANSVGVPQSNNRQANSVGFPSQTTVKQIPWGFPSQTTVKQIPLKSVAKVPQSNNRQATASPLRVPAQKGR